MATRTQCADNLIRMEATVAEAMSPPMGRRPLSDRRAPHPLHRIENASSVERDNPACCAKVVSIADVV
jgi:hypothetical protein